MKKIAFILCLLIAGVTNLQAQSDSTLYIPYNIQQAYKKGTRSKDGRPGKNYWQNHGNYHISIRVNPPDRTVHGSEQITYFNDSPDTLNKLVYSLILNHHKPGVDRQRSRGAAPKAFLTSGVHIDKYVVNGTKREWDSRRDGTWKAKKLAHPLDPGDSIHLAIDWHYNLSKKSGREGAIDSTTFYLAYFYPRVAVYDDYNGWDEMNFTGDQEFYNDFNNYTFNVTVPKNFIVWATGTLQNPRQVLRPKYARRLKKSRHSDSVIHIATPKDWSAHKITKNHTFNTWKWKANNITDIAMAISNHYDWDASSVVVNPKTGRRASVQSAYADSAADFHHMVHYGRHALSWLSQHWPGVPYPFPKTTIVSGYADMEYPMMVNDRSTTAPGGFHLSMVNDFQLARFIVEHELSHSWFPFYMGTNETRWGFMDEGWATTFEHLIGINDIGKKRADELYRVFRVDGWIHNMSSAEQIPIITPGNMLQGPGLGTNEYGKASLGYLAMKDLLGNAMFRKCLHGFMRRWHGKHPMPWDFFYSFNNISGRNLNWFWNNWFFSHNYMDIAVASVKLQANEAQVKVKNIGGFDIPFDVVVHYADGSTSRTHETPIVWKGHQNETMVSVNTTKKVKEISLDNGIFVDANPADNTWKK